MSEQGTGWGYLLGARLVSSAGPWVSSVRSCGFRPPFTQVSQTVHVSDRPRVTWHDPASAGVVLC